MSSIRSRAARSWVALLQVAVLTGGVYVPTAWAGGAGGARLGREGRIIGPPEADQLRSTNGVEVIVGSGGDDAIEASSGDYVCGGPGSDTITGGRGSQSLAGGPGEDSIEAGPDNDRILGDGGNDTLEAG